MIEDILLSQGALDPLQRPRNMLEARSGRRRCLCSAGQKMWPAAPPQPGFKHLFVANVDMTGF